MARIPTYDGRKDLEAYLKDRTSPRKDASIDHIRGYKKLTVKALPTEDHKMNFIKIC